MQRATLYLIFAILLGFGLVSCDSDPSLQRYFVDSQESANFITQDIPLSMLTIDQSGFSEEQKEAYNSVKKLNFLGYKANEDDMEKYNSELNKVKTILKAEKYNDLMDFNTGGSKISVKYVGNDEEADEIVVLGSSDAMGFAVLRLLGNDMSPEKIATLAAALQTSNLNGEGFQNIMKFFK